MPERRKTYHEDVVRHAGSSAGDNRETAVVVRSWFDEDDAMWNAPRPAGAPQDDLERALRRGEVGIYYYPSATRAIVQESDLQVLDRSFQIGDTVKRSPRATRSGVITNVSVKLQLEHVFSKQRIGLEDALTSPAPADWVDAKEVQNQLKIVPSDHVVYGDWVGVVEEVFEEALMEVEGAGDLARVCDVGSGLSVGSHQVVSDAHPVAQMMPELLGQRATCVDVKQTVVCVNWLGINQKLTPEQQDSRPRPKRFWSDINRLTLVSSFAEHALAVGDRAIFKTPELAAKHGLRPSLHGPDLMECWVMTIVGTKSQVEVLWNDATRTTEEASTLVPYVNITDDDCWPGDFAKTSKTREGEQKIGVVQRTDPDERLVKVRWYGTDEVEEVPSLELELHANEALVFGLHRGEHVLLSTKSTGQPIPYVAKVGEIEPDLPDTDSLRLQISDVGMQVARMHLKETPLVLPKPESKATDVDWYGKVLDVLPDGQVVVSLPGRRNVTTSVDLLTLLDDGFEDDDGGWSAASPQSMDLEEDAPWIGEDGDEVDEDGWEDDDELESFTDDEEDEEDYSDLSGDDGEEEDAKPNANGHAKENATTAEEGAKAADATGLSAATPMDESSDAGEGSSNGAAAAAAAAAAPEPVKASPGQDTENWSRFSVLESAPSDHHFIREPIPQPKKAFVSRLHREFKILQDSLPDSILVRTYEDRQDLLRFLIFGPDGTPYADAPFFFDLCLKGTFPQEPPLVHFHSFTNGAGRINPNLYEEGKVCLSLLNTWQGEDRSESWSAARSSLLQVAVSIQSLVLVREPFYLEPTFEKLVNTGEGDVSSRLYSERAFILAQGFVRRALERPLEGFERELEFFYLGGGSGEAEGSEGRASLGKLIKRAEALIEESEAARARREAESAAAEANGDAGVQADGEDGEQPEEGRSAAAKKPVDEKAVERLSGGGIIVLRRTLKALEEIRVARSSKGDAAMSEAAPAATAGEGAKADEA